MLKALPCERKGLLLSQPFIAWSTVRPCPGRVYPARKLVRASFGQRTRFAADKHPHMHPILRTTLVLLASAAAVATMAQGGAPLVTEHATEAVLATATPVRRVCEDPVPGGTKAVPFTMPAKPKKTTARMVVSERAAQWARRS